MRTPVLVALLASLLLTGCMGPSRHDGDAYVLDMRLVDLGHPEEGRYADLGQHCGDVDREEDTLTFWLWPDEERPDGAWLAVFPQLPEGWGPSIGMEPYKAGLPHRLGAEVSGEKVDLGHIEVTGEDRVRIDGRPVALPHEWDVMDEDGEWRLEMTIHEWEGDVFVDQYTGLCD